MNDQLIKETAHKLKITSKQVETVLSLLEEGNTIPFIARYRKEATNGLDEEQIKEINEVYTYEVNLAKKKEDTIRLIDEKDMLTKELEEAINKSTKLIEIDDIYRPFREKRKTKASEAIKLGLKPLAEEILKNNSNDVSGLVAPYISDKVKDYDFAIEQVSFIIAEIISDDAKYRKQIRDYIFKNGSIVSKERKTHDDEKGVYKLYYEFSEHIKRVKPHQTLALSRAEKEKVLSVKLDFNNDDVFNIISKSIIKNNNETTKIIEDSINDSLKRLILPSIEREIRNELFNIAEETAIDNFSNNVENLLLTPPIKEKVVLGFDPAFRTGCKLAVLDKNGDLLHVGVIYPHEPVNKIKESKEEILNLIDKYNIDIIAIGNGTASRESERFIADVIKESKKNVEYIIISEAGASVYSASKIAQDEFPNLTVDKRSAISIGRRLQDSLSELVKIDPKSIGVGLYQHDVNNKKLDNSLTFVVEKVVNRIGVNINTASYAILGYISGLTKPAINKLITYRNKVGIINTREELLKKKVLTPKAYEQSIGFLRILDGVNELDKTDIHPESYDDTYKLLNHLELDVSDIGTDLLIEKIDSIKLQDLVDILKIDKYTLEDIILSLKKPSRDLRDELDSPVLKSDVLDISDLSIGDKVQGTVRNVIDFGAFIDIGLENDGLAHISKLSKRFIKHPSEIVSVGDIVDCYIVDIDTKRKQVSLSLLSDK